MIPENANNSHQEAQTGILELDGDRPDKVDMLLHHLYTLRLPVLGGLSIGETGQLLTTADKYDCRLLANHCILHLQTAIEKWEAYFKDESAPDGDREQQILIWADLLEVTFSLPPFLSDAHTLFELPLDRCMPWAGKLTVQPAVQDLLEQNPELIL